MLKKQHLYLIVSAILLFAPQLMAVDGGWVEFSNPYRIGTIGEVSAGYDTSDARYIFAASVSDSGWLWMTTDNGDSWDRNHNIGSHYHNRVEIESDGFGAGWTLVPSNGTHVDANAGPYYTNDKAVDWTLKDTGLDSIKQLYALAGDQNSDSLSTAFVGGMGNSSNNYRKLFKTTNAGTVWFQSQSGIPSGDSGIVHDIAICPANSNYMYLAYAGASGYGFYRSTNAGANWVGKPVIDVIDDPETLYTAIAIAVHPTDKDLVALIEKSPTRYRLWLTEDATAETPHWVYKDCLPDGEPLVATDVDFSSYRSEADSGFRGYIAYEHRDVFGYYCWVASFTAL